MSTEQNPERPADAAAPTWVVPATAEPLAEPTRSRWQRSRLWVGAAALVIAGLGGGVAIGAAVHTSGSDGRGRAGAPNGAPGQALPGYGSQNGNGLPGDGDRGGRDGEQHVTGTISAVTTAAVTVKTSTGSSTYRVSGTTQILRNGSPATLAQLKAGDPVEVHVLTGGTVERILAGTLPRRPGD